jgi:iron complex outermembrane receptor protein
VRSFLFFPRLLSTSGAFAALLALCAPALAQAPPPSAPQAPPPPPALAPPPSGEKGDDAIDVRVEGDRAAAPRASRDPNVASYVARGEDLRRPGASAVDVLLASPGVEPSRSGAGSDLATLSIRGAPSAELPVYLAGIRLNDDVTGTADLSTIPLFALDRAEIYRGNAPPDADRLGIGGAVFFEPRLPSGTHAGVAGGFGSFGELSLEGHASLGDARGGALFAFRQSSAKNDFTFTDDRGTRDPRDDRTVTRANGDASTFDAWALGRVALPGGGRLVLLAGTFAREQGVVGATTLPANFARSATQRELAAASARLPCSFGAASGEAGSPGAATPGSTSARAAAGSGAPAIERCAIEMATSVIASRRDIHDPYGELGFLSTRIQTSGERWEQKLGVRARIGDAWRVGARAFVEADRLDVDIQDGLRTRSARLSVTGSADAAYRPIERLELFALAGGECHTTVGSGAACASGGPAGRAGVRVLAPLGFEALASGGSYVRVPSLGELYGLSATVLGNPQLLPERDYSAEAGVRWSGAAASGAVRAYVDATGFGRFAENLIAYRRTSLSAIAPFNVASARILGLELTAGLDLFHHLRAQVSLTAADPRNTTPGLIPGATGLLPFHAPFTSASLLELYADLEGRVRFVDRVAIAARFAYRAGRYADAAESVYLRDQRDLGLDASAFIFRRRVAARASITNLLDVTSGDLLGFPLPGRAYHASLAISLL